MGVTIPTSGDAAKYKLSARISAVLREAKSTAVNTRLAAATQNRQQGYTSYYLPLLRTLTVFVSRHTLCVAAEELTMSFERYYPPFRTDFVGAAYAVNLIWELDPVVKRGFFTTTRNGYRFGQTIKTASKPGANHWERGSTEYTKDGLLQTIHALRFRRPFDAYGHRFSPADRVLFVPDYTGKIFMIYAYNHRNFEDTRAGKNVPSDQSAYFIYLYLTGMNESHWPAAKLEPYIRRATFLSNPGEIDRFIGAGAQYRVKALG